MLAAQMLCTASNVGVMAEDVERAEQMAVDAMTLVGDDWGPSAVMAKLSLGSALALRGKVADGLSMTEPVLAAKQEALLDPTATLPA